MLLDLLPAQECERLRGRLTRVHLGRGHDLIWPDAPIEHVYFPVDCVASTLALGAAGEVVETGLVGREGMVGLPVFLGAATTPQRVFVSVSGEAWRMRAAHLREEVRREGPLVPLLLRYTHAMLVMTGQGVLCNRLHALEQRAARWLLLCHDRVDGDEFPLTHAFLAQILGVRRASATVALGVFQKAGLIDYHRGQVVVRDRRGLEGTGCECYGVIAREFARLTSSVTPRE